MTNKHTAGPWEISEIKPAYSPAYLEIATPSETVCIIQSGPFSSAAIEPNARLIAAAPDLLAALEMVNEAAQGHIQINQKWLAAITGAAIAKAKGE